MFPLNGGHLKFYVKSFIKICMYRFLYKVYTNVLHVLYSKNGVKKKCCLVQKCFSSLCIFMTFVTKHKLKLCTQSIIPRNVLSLTFDILIMLYLSYIFRWIFYSFFFHSYLYYYLFKLRVNPIWNRSEG